MVAYALVLWGSLQLADVYASIAHRVNLGCNCGKSWPFPRRYRKIVVAENCRRIRNFGI